MTASAGCLVPSLLRNLTTVTNSRLTQYPLSIDPTSPSIDACMDDGSRKQYRQFCRVMVDAAELPFTRTVQEAHIFGDHVAIRDCTIALAYSHTGQLTRLLSRSARGLDEVELAQEVTGLRELFPSIRHTFHDEHARRRYLSLLEKMQAAVRDGNNPSPRDAAELIMILAQSPTPVRSVHVVIPDAGTA